MIEGPNPDSLQEGDVAYPARILLNLSEAPTANIKLVLNVSTQIALSAACSAWALDKCPTAGAAHEWRELSVNELATVRCCSDEQPKTVCKSRKKPGGECLPERATYVEAEQACAEVQMRLCTKKELQDICCGTGCGYNNNVVWSRRDNANSQDCGNSHDSACRFLCLFVRGSHPWLV